MSFSTPPPSIKTPYYYACGRKGRQYEKIRHYLVHALLFYDFDNRVEHQKLNHVAAEFCHLKGVPMIQYKTILLLFWRNSIQNYYIVILA